MKILRIIQYDIEQGILVFWRRYVLAVLLCIVICVMFNRQSEYFLLQLVRGWLPPEYGLQEFWGRLPFHFNMNLSMDSFTIPFSWLLIYLVLAYCIGSYIRDDMQGFGVQLMIKSKKRYIWWFSKCVCCVLINIIYFGLFWCVNLSFSWIKNGDISFKKNMLLLQVFFGNAVAGTDVKKLVVIGLLMPFLVGIVQSLFQMLVTVCVGGAAAMTILMGMLVISTYYAGPFFVHGYAMAARYFPDGMDNEYKPLEYGFGIGYLCIMIVLLILFGYLIIRKKNILEKQ